MKKYKSHTLKEYLNSLSKKTPIPGGGSAAALTAALGLGLISMVANYSKEKSKSKRIEKRILTTIKTSEQIRKRLLQLVDLDAEAYLKVVKSRKSSASARQKALKQARSVPAEVTRLCYKAVQLTPFLIKNGNKHLASDLKIAVEMLLAAYNASLINVEINS